jgi:hypothetical protein
MTQQAFQERYATMTGFRWSQLENYLQAVPCNCGKKACPGWQMITLPTELPPLQMSKARSYRSPEAYNHGSLTR